jgi:hypothetical protein
LRAMSPDTAAAVTAWATCFLAAFAFLAFIAAGATYVTQAKQLKVARQEAKALRAPVFEGEVTASAPGAKSPFVASIRLRSNEPPPVVRLIMQGATVAECPIGFPPGTEGVQPDDPSYQPPGWQNDVLVRSALWEILFPNDQAIWQVELHPRAHDLNPVPEVARARADCRGLEGEEWIVPVTLKLAPEVRDAMRPPPTATVL